MILLSVLAVVASSLVLGCTSATTIVNNPTAAPTTTQTVPDNAAGTSGDMPTALPDNVSQITPPDVPTTIPTDDQGALNDSTAATDNASNGSSAIDNSASDGSTADNSTVDNGAADNSGPDNSTVDNGSTDNPSTDDSGTDSGALPSDDPGVDTGGSSDNSTVSS